MLEHRKIIQWKYYVLSLLKLERGSGTVRHAVAIADNPSKLVEFCEQERMKEDGGMLRDYIRPVLAKPFIEEVWTSDYEHLKRFPGVKLIEWD